MIVVGAFGAIAGDSALYWISRASGARVRRRLDRAKKNPRVASGLALMEKSAPLLIGGGGLVTSAFLAALSVVWRRGRAAPAGSAEAAAS